MSANSGGSSDQCARVQSLWDISVPHTYPDLLMEMVNPESDPEFPNPEVVEVSYFFEDLICHMAFVCRKFCWYLKNCELDDDLKASVVAAHERLAKTYEKAASMDWTDQRQLFSYMSEKEALSTLKTARDVLQKLRPRGLSATRYDFCFGRLQHMIEMHPKFEALWTDKIKWSAVWSLKEIFFYPRVDMERILFNVMEEKEWWRFETMCEINNDFWRELEQKVLPQWQLPRRLWNRLKDYYLKSKVESACAELGREDVAETFESIHNGSELRQDLRDKLIFRRPPPPPESPLLPFPRLMRRRRDELEDLVRLGSNPPNPNGLGGNEERLMETSPVGPNELVDVIDLAARPETPPSGETAEKTFRAAAADTSPVVPPPPSLSTCGSPPSSPWETEESNEVSARDASPIVPPPPCLRTVSNHPSPRCDDDPAVLSAPPFRRPATPTPVQVATPASPEVITLDDSDEDDQVPYKRAPTPPSFPRLVKQEVMDTENIEEVVLDDNDDVVEVVSDDADDIERVVSDDGEDVEEVMLDDDDDVVEVVSNDVVVEKEAEEKSSDDDVNDVSLASSFGNLVLPSPDRPEEVTRHGPHHVFAAVVSKFAGTANQKEPAGAGRTTNGVVGNHSIGLLGAYPLSVNSSFPANQQPNGSRAQSTAKPPVPKLMDMRFVVNGDKDERKGTGQTEPAICQVAGGLFGNQDVDLRGNQDIDLRGNQDVDLRRTQDVDLRRKRDVDLRSGFRTADVDLRVNGSGGGQGYGSRQESRSQQDIAPHVNFSQLVVTARVAVASAQKSSSTACDYCFGPNARRKGKGELKMHAESECFFRPNGVQCEYCNSVGHDPRSCFRNPLRTARVAKN